MQKVGIIGGGISSLMAAYSLLKNSKEIMKLLEDINRRGTTVIVITHNKDIVDKMQKRVINLSSGMISSDNHKAGYQAMRNRFDD